MEPKCGTSARLVALGLLVIVAALVALLAWESRGRPGLRPPAVPPLREAADRMAMYQRLCDGKTLAGKGKHADALAVFEEIVRAEAGSSYGWDADIQAAHSMGYLGRCEDALARLDRIIADCPLDEDVPRAQLAKADVHSLAGQHEAGIEVLEKLIVAYTDVRPWICEEALVGMMMAYNRTHQFGLVRGALDRLIMDYPGSENTRRIWAKKQAAVLCGKLHGLQQPEIDRLLAEKAIKKVDKLGEGLTTWTADDGPYLITQSLVVRPSATLRIKAGTRVRFGVFGGLQIEGRLEVPGTADRPVHLLPLGDDPAGDFWAGITLEEGKSKVASAISHCRLVGAEIRLDARGGHVELDHCTFDRCGHMSVLAARGAQLVMANCQVAGGSRVGVECEPTAVLRMTDCQITGLTTHGLALKEVSGDSFIRRSLIEKCGWDGLLVRGECSPTVDDCRILDNGANGVRAVEGGSPAVVNTRVANNAGAGIRLKERWDAAIRSSTIVGNQGGGIVAEVRCNGEIIGNRVENNGTFGLCLRLDCAPSITDNRFFKNKGPGLLLQNSQPKTLRDNQFVENAEAAVRNEGPGTVLAAHNWSGATGAEEIGGMIQDGSDHPDWGKVEFQPWLPEPPATR